MTLLSNILFLYAVPNRLYIGSRTSGSISLLALIKHEEVVVKFDVSAENNYAAFIDKQTVRPVFVDPFDNKEFDVRIATMTEHEPAGITQAALAGELNEKFGRLYP
jgi:hypothetical protein